MKQWEYLEAKGEIGGVRLPYDKKTIKLDDSGKNGWELITSNGGNFIFKREITPSPTQTVSRPATTRQPEHNPCDDLLF